MAEKEEHTLTQTILEPPPPPDAPVPIDGVGLLNESVGAMTAKLAVAEALLTLLNRDSKFNDFTRDLLLTLMKVVQSEAGSLLEVDHKNNILFFRSVVGRSSDRVTNFQIPMGQGIVGYVAESRQPLIVSNLTENKMHLKSIGDAVGFEARNLVALPLIIRGKVYGVIELLNRVGEPHFTDTDIELLNYCCELASKAIEVRLMIAWAMHQVNVKQGKPGTKDAA